MREDGSYTKEEFTERKAEVDNELIASRISRSESRIEQFDAEASLTYAERYISDLGRQWTDLPAHLYPRFQKLVFPEGIPYTKNKGFGTAKLGLIFEINETSYAQKSDLVDLGRIELPPVQCECTVLPLDYRPILSNRARAALYHLTPPASHTRSVSGRYRPLETGVF